MSYTSHHRLTNSHYVSTLVLLVAALGFFNNTTFSAQPEVVLQGTAQGVSKPVLFFPGAVSADSAWLLPSDEASEWSKRLTKVLNISGAVKVVDRMPDTLVPGVLIPNAKLEVRKASSGGAVTLSLYAGDGVRPYWFKSYATANQPIDGALLAGSTLQMQLVGVPGFATARMYYADRVRGGAQELFTCNAMGEDKQQLSKFGTILMSPSISPDGSKIAFTSFRNGNADVWLQSVATGEAHVLYSSPHVDSSPAISPDGHTVVFASSVGGNTEIYTIDINGTNRTQLTFSPNDISTSPSWSPKGDRITFTSDRSGTPQVYSMASDGTDVRRLTFEGEYNDSPCYSPQGDKIVYVRRENGVFQLYSTDPAGITHKRLLYYSEDQKDPAFTPGGFRISFVTVWRGETGIALLTPETGDVDFIIGGVDAQRPVWGPPLTNE